MVADEMFSFDMQQLEWRCAFHRVATFLSQDLNVACKSTWPFIGYISDFVFSCDTSAIIQDNDTAVMRLISLELPRIIFRNL